MRCGLNKEEKPGNCLTTSFLSLVIQVFCPTPFLLFCRIYVLFSTLSLFSPQQSLAMFASTISLGLALLPFTLGAVHNVQVGKGGDLLFEPEAIVRSLSVI